MRADGIPSRDNCLQADGMSHDGYNFILQAINFRYKLEGYLLVYLWNEKVKRNGQDPLTELLRLVGSSSDKCLDKEYEANTADAVAGSEQGAAALPTERPAPTVEMCPCIFCAGTFKVIF